MKIRVIDFGYVSPIRSQAIFHGIAYAIKPDDDPVITLSNPDAPYVCVGMHQEVAKEVDEEFCHRQGLPVYRRHIGGGTVYLDQNQLFFHFIFPRNKAPLKADELYVKFIEPVVQTYRHFGIAAQYHPVNDIQVNGRKIGGTGAASLENATVMAGSFMFDFDSEMMAKAIKVPSEKFRDKLYQTLGEYITTIKKELASPPSRESVIVQFIKDVSQTLNIEPIISEATQQELEHIEIMESQLADPEWTYQVGRRFVDMGVKISADRHLTESTFKAKGGMIRVHLLEHEFHIEDIVISGDFTCLPESGINTLAQALIGCILEQAALQQKIQQTIQQFQLDIPAVSAEDITTAIMMAVNQKQRQ